MADRSDKEHKPAKSKEDALWDMFTPEIRRQIVDVIHAVDNYKVDRSDEAYTKLTVSVLLAATRNAAMFAPVTGLSKDKKGMELGTFESPAGKGYVLCTSPEEAAACPEQIIILVNSAAIVRRAVADTEYKGIYINPYGKWPVFFQRDHILMLLDLMEKRQQSEN